MAAQPGAAAPGVVWNGSSWIVDPTYSPAAVTAKKALPAATPGEIGATRGPAGGLVPRPSNYVQMPGQPGTFYDPVTGGLWRGGHTYNPYGAGAQAGGLFSPGTLAMVRAISDKHTTPLTTQPTYNPSAALPETNALADLAKIDPTSEKIRGELGPGYLSDLDAATAGTLPPGVLREIQQDVRGNQVARGNYEGAAQAAEEAMTTGTAGLQYLNNVRNAALGYLGSGQTKYNAGANYTDRALNQQTAAMTGQMTPTYNPTIGTPPAYSFIDPGAGAKFAEGTQGFMGQGVGATPGRPNTSGQYIGAGIGALGSIGGAAVVAAGGALFCQAARVIYGDATPKQLMFRDWILFKAPAWLRTLYARYAEKFGNWIADKPIAKWITKMLMDRAIHGNT